MLSGSVVICAAGGGKTTEIVKQALSTPDQRIAILTYTDNNINGIRECIVEHNKVPAPHIEVISWFAFLLRELARPYQRALYEQHISGIHWESGRSNTRVAATNIRGFYFTACDVIRSDRLAQFVCACEVASGGRILDRLKQRFDHIYIDEIQDLAGYDLDLLEGMMKAGVKLTLVGDHRQPTFRTNHSAKNSAYGGYSIIKKFREWERRKLCTVDYRRVSHRCNQEITTFADTLYPSEPTTTSLNMVRTGHDGVFQIPAAAVADYMLKYGPQVLRYDKRSKCLGLEAMNFGISKGLTFERILIFPTKAMERWLSTGNGSHIDKSLAKTYVAITRARYSVTFVMEHMPAMAGLQSYRP